MPRLSLVLLLLSSVAFAKPPRAPKQPKPPKAAPVSAPEPVPEPSPPAPVEKKSPRIALPTPGAGPGISPEVVTLTEQVFEKELRALDGVALVTAAELTSLLGIERARALLGAQAEASPSDAFTDVLAVQLVAKGNQVEVTARRTNSAATRLFTRQVATSAQALQSLAADAVKELLPEFERTTPAPQAAPQRKLLRIAVMDARLTGDVPPRAAAALNQSLTPELRKLEGVLAISSQEVRDLLGVERQRALVGCNEGVSCMGELVDALGAEELLTLDLTLVGSKYALTARRIDTLQAKVVQSHLQQFDRRDGEELLAIVGPMIEALFPERTVRAGQVRGVEPAVIRRLNPPPLPKWVFFSTTALALAAGGGGATFTLLAADRRRQFDALTQRSLSMEVSGAQLVALEREGRQLQTVALGFFIGAGGLAAAMLVESFLTDWNDDRAALAVLPLLSPNAAGVLVRF